MDFHRDFHRDLIGIIHQLSYKLDDGWPESVEEQGLLLLVWRHNITNNIWKMCYRQSRRGVARQNSEKCKTIVCIANTFTHRRFYTQKLLHTEAFTHRSFYTEAFTHRRYYTQTLLHTDAFTHRRFYTHRHLTSVFGDPTSFRAKGKCERVAQEKLKSQFYLSFWRSNLISCERVARDKLKS